MKPYEIKYEFDIVNIGTAIITLVANCTEIIKTEGDIAEKFGFGVFTRPIRFTMPKLG